MSFDFDFTVEKLHRCCPAHPRPQELFDVLSDILPKNNINTKLRVAQFLAQCGHESNDFTVLQENLNYSALGLAKTWPSRYSVTKQPPYTPNDLANKLNRNPEAIANNVYANRLGNGPESSGDGWKFRGHGAIQITGKENTSKFAKYVGMTLDQAVDYMNTTKGAIDASCWYWIDHNLNAYSDQGDTLTVTKIINGGTNGLDDRKFRYERCMGVL